MKIPNCLLINETGTSRRLFPESLYADPLGASPIFQRAPNGRKRQWLCGLLCAGLWVLAIGNALAETPAENPIALFNGQDLTGWHTEGNSHWEVQQGVLVGRQGPNNAPGDLLTDAEFDNFELTVVFKMHWPGNSGVWYRYQSANQAFQADILEYKEPFALTGSLYCTGKMFIARNTDAKLVRRDDWNTLVIRAVGDRQVITLNGTQVADVRDTTSDHGRIGFQIHAGREFEPMRIFIQSAKLRQLDPTVTK